MVRAKKLRADHILAASRRDPSVILASFGANLLSLAVPMAMIHIYDRVIPNQGYQTLLALGIMVFAAILAEATLRAARRHLLELSAAQFERVAYPAAISALLLADPAQAERSSHGQLYRCVTAIERLRNLQVGNAALDPLDLPFALLFLGVIALISPMLALSVFLLLATAFLILRHARRGVLEHQIRRKDNEERRHSFLTEVLRGTDVIKNMRIEDFMLRRYERLLGGAASISADTARSVQLAQGFTAAIGTLSPLFVGSVGAMLVIQGQMSVGSLAAIVLLTGRIIQPVLRIEAFLAGSDNLRQHRDDLEAVLSIPSRPDGELPLDAIEEVSLVGVETSFEPVLGIGFRKLDLTVHRGECIAITGGSRQARHLFLRVLAGELALVQGRVLLNGHPVEDYALVDRQRQIRLLGGENTLIEGTLLENLTAFQPTLYRDRAVALAQHLGIEETISQSAEGFGLHVGPDLKAGLPKSLADAITIVGGLVQEPDLLLFDEANGALDRETDARLLKILSDQCANRTTFLVSNRPSYLELATRSYDISDVVAHAVSEAAA